MFSGCEQFAHVLIVLSMLAVCFIKIDTKVGIDVKFGSCFFSMDLHKTNKRRKNTASCTSRVVFCRLRAQGDTKLKNEFFYLCMLRSHRSHRHSFSVSRSTCVCLCVFSEPYKFCRLPGFLIRDCSSCPVANHRYYTSFRQNSTR